MRRVVVALLVAACRAPPPPHEALTADALRASVEVLASDAFGGREVLSPGRAAAADWLVTQLEGTGLQPLPGQGDLRVDFPLYRPAWDLAQTDLHVGDVTYATPDMAPLDFSESGAAEALVVFAGYGGVTGPGFDDYAGLDVAGRIVLVFAPPAPHMAPMPGYTRMRLKAQAAQSRGAAAIVFVPNPSFPKAVDPPRMPPGWFLPAEEGSVPLLAVLASVEVGAALVTPEGRSLADAETALAAGGRPADVGVVGATARLRATAAPETLALRGENLFAVLPGTDLADEWIVVGAHYDHIGIKDIAGDNICNGADDNASGSAMVLGLARALASRSEPPRRTVVFAWFDAEEAGLLGSSTALLQGDLPVDKLVGMVNFDMLGRNPDKPVRSLVSGFDPSPVYAAARARHLRLLPLPAHKGHSDIVSFYKVGVPVVGFFTGRHPDYHMPSDEAGTLDYARMERIGGMAWDLVVALADGEWSPTAARKRRSP